MSLCVSKAHANIEGKLKDASTRTRIRAGVFLTLNLCFVLFDESHQFSGFFVLFDSWNTPVC